MIDQNKLMLEPWCELRTPGEVLVLPLDYQKKKKILNNWKDQCIQLLNASTEGMNCNKQDDLSARIKEINTTLDRL